MVLVSNADPLYSATNAMRAHEPRNYGPTAAGNVGLVLSGTAGTGGAASNSGGACSVPTTAARTGIHPHDGSTVTTACWSGAAGSGWYITANKGLAVQPTAPRATMLVYVTHQAGRMDIYVQNVDVIDQPVTPLGYTWKVSWLLLI